MTETPQSPHQGDPHVGSEGPQHPLDPTPQQPTHEQPTYDQPTYDQPTTPQPAYQPAYQQAYAQPGHTQPYGYGGAPTGLTSDDRTWASAAHWGTLVAAWLAMGFLAPLLIMLTVGNRSPFVRRHAVESLNFQISLLIYSAAAVLLSILTLGLGLIVVIPVFFVALVWVLVLLIQASVKAGNGEEYRYPLTLRLVS